MLMVSQLPVIPLLLALRPREFCPACVLAEALSKKKAGAWGSGLFRIVIQALEDQLGTDLDATRRVSAGDLAKALIGK